MGRPQTKHSEGVRMPMSAMWLNHSSHYYINVSRENGGKKKNGRRLQYRR